MDPTSSVISIIAFGITICDGVVKYCHGWKSQGEDVRSLTELANGLKQLLEDIRNLLQSNPTLAPTVSAGLDNAVQACDKHVEALLRLGGNYSTGQTAGLMQKTEVALKKLKYPFERKALLELRDILTQFRGNVQLALGILNA
jgi:ElaB/YqjD/DUF883 family membrane-anchored ribosome-binding protein